MTSRYRSLNKFIEFSFSRCITLFKETWKLGHFKLNTETLTLALNVAERRILPFRTETTIYNENMQQNMHSAKAQWNTSSWHPSAAAAGSCDTRLIDNSLIMRPAGSKRLDSTDPKLQCSRFCSAPFQQSANTSHSRATIGDVVSDKFGVR